MRIRPTWRDAVVEILFWATLCLVGVAVVWLIVGFVWLFDPRG